MKSKGYSKGGAKMMKARGGKMAKGYSKGGAKMMKARGGKMAKGYSKGGAKMMRANKGGFGDSPSFKGYTKKPITRAGVKNPNKGGFTDPKKLINRAKVLGGSRAMNSRANQIKAFKEFLGALPLPTRTALVKKGIKKLVNPALKNLGTVGKSKVKTLKDFRSLKKKK
jgi:hypothetical protein